mmetsp:Transcript_101746/g.164036  ORF Transcript_101746/g.164036 Transcript_101746/m.164036 type:complete len:217 (-) Transcript_101746:513-1163(-)
MCGAHSGAQSSLRKTRPKSPTIGGKILPKKWRINLGGISCRHIRIVRGRQKEHSTRQLSRAIRLPLQKLQPNIRWQRQTRRCIRCCTDRKKKKHFGIGIRRTILSNSALNQENIIGRGSRVAVTTRKPLIKTCQCRGKCARNPAKTVDLQGFRLSHIRKFSCPIVRLGISRALCGRLRSNRRLLKWKLKQLGRRRKPTGAPTKPLSSISSAKSTTF